MDALGLGRCKNAFRFSSLGICIDLVVGRGNLAHRRLLDVVRGGWRRFLTDVQTAPHRFLGWAQRGVQYMGLILKHGFR